MDDCVCERVSFSLSSYSATDSIYPHLSGREGSYNNIEIDSSTSP
jgi:hypothetical protein